MIISAKGRDVGRVREYKGIGYPSVTTILSWGVAKPKLIPWAVGQAADYVITNLEELSSMSPRAAKSAILKSADAKRDISASRGGKIHHAIEKISRGESITISEDIKPYMESFASFVNEKKPDFLLSEIEVYNTDIGYSGGVDSLIVIDDKLYIVDFKTGNFIHADVALQLAAYSRATFYIGPNGEEIAMPYVRDAAVLHIGPEGYEFKDVSIEDDVFETFLSAKKMFEWNTNEHYFVIGAEIQ